MHVLVTAVFFFLFTPNLYNVARTRGPVFGHPLQTFPQLLCKLHTNSELPANLLASLANVLTLLAAFFLRGGVPILLI